MPSIPWINDETRRRRRRRKKITIPEPIQEPSPYPTSFTWLGYQGSTDDFEHRVDLAFGANNFFLYKYNHIGPIAFEVETFGQWNEAWNGGYSLSVYYRAPGAPVTSLPIELAS